MATIDIEFEKYISDNLFHIEAKVTEPVKGNHGPSVSNENSYPDEGGAIEISRVYLQNQLDPNIKIDIDIDGFYVPAYVSMKHNVMYSPKYEAVRHIIESAAEDYYESTL